MTKKKIVESLTEEQMRIMQKASPALNRQVGGDFTKIDSAERQQILLRAAPHARQPSMLWTKDRKLTKKFYVKRYLEFHGQLECEFADRASRVLGEVDRELDLAGTMTFSSTCDAKNRRYSSTCLGGQSRVGTAFSSSAFRRKFSKFSAELSFATGRMVATDFGSNPKYSSSGSKIFRFWTSVPAGSAFR